MKALIVFLFLCAVAGAGFWYVNYSGKPSLPPGAPEPTTFEECSRYYPVTGTRPRQCTNGAGIVLSENLGNALDFHTITVGKPEPNDLVSSPLRVVGDAAAEWFEDGTAIHVVVLDANDRSLGEGRIDHAQVLRPTGNHFDGTVFFVPPTFGSFGTLLITRGSSWEGLRIPVKFK